MSRHRVNHFVAIYDAANSGYGRINWMAGLRLTAAEAVVRFLAAQMTEHDGGTVPLFGGVFAIFGHGNVAGLGPALHGVREQAADVPRP